MLFCKNINSEEMDVPEDTALTHRANINDYCKNYCMEFYQTIKSSSILHHLEMYLLEDKIRQRRHRANFKRENIKENITF